MLLRIPIRPGMNITHLYFVSAVEVDISFHKVYITPVPTLKEC